MNNDMTALVPQSHMPAMQVTSAIDRYKAMNSFIGNVLRANTDYGIIPGTGTKRVLLKPGAEKLSTFFGLAPTFEQVRVVEDWTGKDYEGEPFFYYLIKCRLSRHGEVVAEGDGSCNSRETKYRYRQAERTCPSCGKANIRKGKDNWYCWKKTDGCGATFDFGDKAIEGQQTGRVLNPDVADLVNTILKMAEKRALIAAVLIAVNASDYFTQDVEDLPGFGEIVQGEYKVIEDEPQPTLPQPEPPAKPNGAHSPEPEPPADLFGARPAAPRKANPPAEVKKPANIKTKQLFALAPAFVKEVPHYARPDGTPNMNHIAMAAKEAGYEDITDANLPAVFEALRHRVQAKQQAAEDVEA